MRILGLETSASHSSVALVEDGHVVCEHFFASRMSLSESLPAHITTVVGTRQISEAGLEAIAVSLGPGSFTGLRVGVAAAKAMAHVLEIPLVGIPTHEALAWPLAISHSGSMCVIQHARKHDVYVSEYAVGPDVLLTLTQPVEVLALDALLTRLAGAPNNVLLVGDGVQKHASQIADALGRRVVLAPAYFAVPRAATVAAMAETRVDEADPQAAFSLRPTYVLTSQAERTHGVDLGLK